MDVFQKLRVWCSSPDAKWELGQIQSISGDAAEILLANGKVSVLYCHGDIVIWGELLYNSYSMFIRLGSDGVTRTTLACQP